MRQCVTCGAVHRKRRCPVCAARSRHRKKLVSQDRLLAHTLQRVRWVYTRCLTYGSGVYIHADWFWDANAFAAYLMALAGCDDANLTLDRIDNSKGYEPGNLRFVTRVEQCYNKRNSLTSKLCASDKRSSTTDDVGR